MQITMNIFDLAARKSSVDPEVRPQLIPMSMDLAPMAHTYTLTGLNSSMNPPSGPASILAIAFLISRSTFSIR